MNARFALELNLNLSLNLLFQSVSVRSTPKGTLRDGDRSNHLHPFLAFLLFSREVFASGNVTTVALGRNVLAERRDCSTGNNFATDRP